MRKIIVYIATSADGYIARPDGGIDWLNRPRPKGNYGMGEFLKSVDTILWGRKTYDLAVAMGAPDGGFASMKSFVFSAHPPAAPAPKAVTFVGEPVVDFLKTLRRARGKNVWVMGGASLIASLLDAGGIDEFIIHVVPTMIGEGIPLVRPRHRTIALDLKSVKKFSDGVARLHYGVRRRT